MGTDEYYRVTNFDHLRYKNQLGRFIETTWANGIVQHIVLEHTREDGKKVDCLYREDEVQFSHQMT